MFSAILVTASATIILLLGIVHLVYTFTGPKLTPRDPDLTSEMKLVSPVISNETSMWKAWVGFNASHSMGAILFGLIYGYLALLRADLLFGSIYLMSIGLAMLAGLFVLARRYWFSIPFAGITISLLLFIGGIATAKQTSTSTFSNATVSPAVAAEEPCAYDRAAMLALDQNAFDQDMQGGWRSVAHQDGCDAAAADLIRDYIAAHDSTASMLFFHEAQLRAFAGQTELALQLFPKTRKSADETDKIGWNHYVDATIAFLKRDRNALAAARERLVNTPRPEDFNPVDIHGNPVDVIWPMNLNVVDGFLECFDKDYGEAYSKCSRPFKR